MMNLSFKLTYSVVFRHLAPPFVELISQGESPASVCEYVSTWVRQYVHKHFLVFVASASAAPYRCASFRTFVCPFVCSLTSTLVSTLEFVIITWKTFKIECSYSACIYLRTCALEMRLCVWPWPLPRQAWNRHPGAILLSARDNTPQNKFQRRGTKIHWICLFRIIFISQNSLCYIHFLCMGSYFSCMNYVFTHGTFIIAFSWRRAVITDRSVSKVENMRK